MLIGRTIFGTEMTEREQGSWGKFRSDSAFHIVISFGKFVLMQFGNILLYFSK